MREKKVDWDKDPFGWLSGIAGVTLRFNENYAGEARKA